MINIVQDQLSNDEIDKRKKKHLLWLAVVKERDMEIGYPKDVKHVAHIGWEGSSSGSAPGWVGSLSIFFSFVIFN